MRSENLYWVILVVLMGVMSVSGCVRGFGDVAGFTDEVYSPEYAEGFRVLGREGSESTIIETRAPWQGADTTMVTRLMIVREGEEVPAGFEGSVVRTDSVGVKRVVCMSSSHIAMLDALGEVDRVVGVSGMDFITNEKILEARERIADVGYDSNINYERLLASRPDIVLLYGVVGANSIEPKLRELGIPVMYVGEYLEEHPLGKAEWLVVIGELVGKQAEVAALVGRVSAEYDSLKQLAGSPEVKRRVMINTPYADSWLMAPTGSYVARLIADAGGEYVYTANGSNRSMPISIEEAYRLVSGADVWINTGQISTMGELMRLYPKFEDTKPVRTGEVWNTTLRQTEGGGNDYWESGVVNPHLVLRDLIKILQPERGIEGEFTYYKRLER